MKSKKPCFSVILCIVGAEFHDPLKELKRHFGRVKLLFEYSLKGHNYPLKE